MWVIEPDLWQWFWGGILGQTNTTPSMTPWYRIKAVGEKQVSRWVSETQKQKTMRGLSMWKSALFILIQLPVHWLNSLALSHLRMPTPASLSTKASLQSVILFQKNIHSPPQPSSNGTEAAHPIGPVRVPSSFDTWRKSSMFKATFMHVSAISLFFFLLNHKLKETK